MPIPDAGSPAELLTGPHHRITPITPRLVRIEYSPSGSFEDRPTMLAIDRTLCDTGVRVGLEQDRIVVRAEGYTLSYDGQAPSPHGLSVRVGSSVWRYGAQDPKPATERARYEGRPYGLRSSNLGGAARTLDGADGAIPLEDGVASTSGIAVLDDTDTMVLVPAEGTGQVSDPFEAATTAVPTPRRPEPGYRDLYVFAAGKDHVAAVGDLFALSGPQPLLPKWALGNWWSRYHKYSEDEYLRLMDRFTAHGVPLSVAVIDMDWHLTKVHPKHGTGWTGYTWDRDLFPDPARFQQALHDRGLKTTLNLHPADGVRAFEDAYEAMAAAMRRPADGSPIEFDASDPEFMRAYFEVLHRGLEQLGTDFWWIDWQQGGASNAPGMDPLWVLNHQHFEDSKHSGQGTTPRGLTFSRYAGPGSHRYPVGFSGDATISWESLAFQPRMTAAGANIGYGWWSHDIGGHMDGYYEPELATRWVQFGVFSPIMRLHSSNSPFSGKEPWRFGQPHDQIQTAHLQLRHRLVPYLHAMNRRAHEEGRSIVEPVYYEDHSQNAYRYLDAYLFGSELLVAPITRPAAADTGRGAVEAYLPAGTWTDIFTEQVYGGGRVWSLHRDLQTTPTLLCGGGFLPLAGASGPDAGLDIESNPADLEVLVGAGEAGAFALWEETETHMSTDTDNWVRTGFVIDPETGTLEIELPEQSPVTDGHDRTFTFALLGFDPDAFTDVRAEGAAVELLPAPDRIPTATSAVRPAPGSARLQVTPTPDGPGPARTVRITSTGFARSLRGSQRYDALRAERVTALLQEARIGFPLKDQIGKILREDLDAILPTLAALGTTPLGGQGEPEDYNLPSGHLTTALTETLYS
jgi:alpha-glucosidase (family GH31 glycosyl hydrolase)